MIKPSIYHIQIVGSGYIFVLIYIWNIINIKNNPSITCTYLLNETSKLQSISTIKATEKNNFP